MISRVGRRPTRQMWKLFPKVLTLLSFENSSFIFHKLIGTLKEFAGGMKQSNFPPNQMHWWSSILNNWWSNHFILQLKTIRFNSISGPCSKVLLKRKLFNSKARYVQCCYLGTVHSVYNTYLKFDLVMLQLVFICSFYLLTATRKCNSPKSDYWYSGRREED